MNAIQDEVQNLITRAYSYDPSGNVVQRQERLPGCGLHDCLRRLWSAVGVHLPQLGGSILGGGFGDGRVQRAVRLLDGQQIGRAHV